MSLDIRWIALVVLVLATAVATWLRPDLVGPVTIAIGAAGLLYLVMRMGR
ncbi:MAG: hypothetical protein ACRDSR_18655 [Pseudonocardiaceae bacterium]